MADGNEATAVQPPQPAITTNSAAVPPELDKKNSAPPPRQLHRGPSKEDVEIAQRWKKEIEQIEVKEELKVVKNLFGGRKSTKERTKSIVERTSSEERTGAAAPSNNSAKEEREQEDDSFTFSRSLPRETSDDSSWQINTKEIDADGGGGQEKPGDSTASNLDATRLNLVAILNQDKNSNLEDFDVDVGTLVHTVEREDFSVEEREDAQTDADSQAEEAESDINLSNHDEDPMKFNDPNPDAYRPETVKIIQKQVDAAFVSLCKQTFSKALDRIKLYHQDADRLRQCRERQAVRERRKREAKLMGSTSTASSFMGRGGRRNSSTNKPGGGGSSSSS
ncbi:unnamed protein product [Amoebophrya sp. A120]|nr:unnamed protein product [Amoebophrya sp. A120]|eukprot:GSA120T00008305001.1